MRAALDRLAVAASVRRLRILAYHDVVDGERFDAQMAHLRAAYTPVSSAEVVAAFRHERPLPARGVWVTFDDASSTVIDDGLGALARFEVPATMFVCPGVVESGQQYWWETVDAALAHGLDLGLPRGPGGGESVVAQLKSLPDDERRDVVDRAARALAAAAAPRDRRPLSRDDLARWLAAGNDLGNHTWDHPCLDRCPPEEQHRQVVDAHRWLGELSGVAPTVFAYPNGNTTLGVEHLLDESGYQLAVLFDHRVASLDQYRFRVSRLRVSSTASDDRFRAIVSGVHGAAYHLRRRFGPWRGVDTALRTGPMDVMDEADPFDVEEWNRATYGRPEVVAQFRDLEGLTGPEARVIDAYVTKDSDILDLGVGGGRTTASLASRARRYVGVDVVPAMIEACRDKFPDLEFRVGDAVDLSAFDSASFDVVMFAYNGLDYLHPVERRARCLREIGRVLRPGGILVFSSHNARAVLRSGPGFEPGAATLARARAVVIAAIGTARLLARALPSRAFWVGTGYLRDSASPHVNFATTPAHEGRELMRAGLELCESLGARFPAPLRRGREPWYYYVARRPVR